MADCSQTLATLAGSDVGRGLTSEELEQLMAVGTVQEIAAGQEIVRQMAPAETVFLPCSGTVMVERNALNGRRQVIAFLRQGDYLGFTATDQYLYSARALEPCRLIKFSRKKFIALCDQVPTLKENMAHINNTVLASMLDHLFAIGQKRAHERLAFLIYQFYLRNDQPAPGTAIHLPMSRTDIGDYLGLTLETSSRAFSRLRNDEVISTPDHHSVVIENQARLEELAEVH